LFFLGVGLATLYQYRIKKLDDSRELKTAKVDSDRQLQLDRAQRSLLEAQTELRAVEKTTGEEIVMLDRRLENVIAQDRSSPE
jgi:hypothetical protein